MRKLIVVFCVFLQNLALAQNKDYSFFCGEYTFISFAYVDPNDWPVFFNTIVKSDSINVDTTDLSSFTKSVYSDNPFISDTEFTYKRAIDIMYENKIENYDFCHKLSNRFAEEFDNVAQKGKIKLATGNTVCYKFASINALFIEFDDLSAWGRFSSIEDIDFNNVKRIVLPISVAEFKKKEKGICITAN